MDDNAIEVRFEEHYRQLVFTCGKPAFDQIRARLFDEAKSEDKYADAEIRWISIHLPPKQKERMGIRGYLFSAGCLVMVVFLGTALCVGIRTIWQWLIAPQ